MTSPVGCGPGRTRSQAIAARRARILQAMVEVVVERGFAGASVTLVIARARVSRRTFDEQFAGLEDCLASVFDLGRKRALELVSQAFAAEEAWQDGMRMALASLLMFLDAEPSLARVWLVESLAAGDWALAYRERSFRELRDLALSSWPMSEDWAPPPLAPESVITSVVGILHAHIAMGKNEPLIGLLGSLMGVVTAPFMSPRAVKREIERGAQLAREIQRGERRSVLSGAAQDCLLEYDRGLLDGERQRGFGLSRPSDSTSSDVVVIPAMLSNPNAHRVRECLLFLAEHPEASNHEVATGIGVTHQSQISRLLNRLLLERLVSKRSAGIGKRNTWRLTSTGHEIVHALNTHTGSPAPGAEKRTTTPHIDR